VCSSKSKPKGLRSRAVVGVWNLVAWCSKELMLQFQLESEDQRWPISQFKRSGRSSLTPAFLSYLDLQLITWGPPNIREDNLLYLFYQFKC
jgi:hypothetical protein